MWLFHLHSAMKIQPFSPVFPLAGSTAKTFFRLSWTFKEKSINHFYNTAFSKNGPQIDDTEKFFSGRVGHKKGGPFPNRLAVSWALTPAVLPLCFACRSSWACTAARATAAVPFPLGPLAGVPSASPTRSQIDA